MSEAIWPASYPQRRLWFLDRLVPDSTAYQLPHALRLRGELDVAALEWALERVTARHAVFRTTFAEQAGEPIQVVHPPGPFPVDIVDLSDTPAAAREAHAADLLRREGQRPLDLTVGPLVRALLIRMGTDDHVLGFVLHHIIFDGWSLGVLYQELATLYEAGRTTKTDPLPPLPTQYGPYAAWQQQYLTGPALEAELGYWRAKLADAPPLLALPTDRPRPAIQTFAGAMHRETMSAELWRALTRFSRSRRVTPFMTLFAGYATLLYRLSGNPDVLIGSPIAGRILPEHEPLIGYFANTVPLRVDLSGDTTSFSELVHRVRGTALEAYAHQQVPFEKLIEDLRPQRTLSHNPLVQAMFTLQNTPQVEPSLAGLDASRFAADPHAAFTDLWLEIWVADEVPRLNLLYSTDLFDRDSVARMAGQCIRLLEQAIREPDTPLWRLSLLSDAERSHPGAHGGTAYPADRLVPELMAAQVAATPGSPAVSFQDRTVTYRELDERASQLAHRLHDHGVGPDDVVALALPRSPELVITVLGILKAGAGFLPLDPEAAPARLASLITDARAGHLVAAAGATPPPAAGLTIITLGDDEPGTPPPAELPTPHPDNLAYVIYTSGSTGRPKPVALTHRGLVNRLNWMRDHLGTTSADRVLHKTPNTFDVSVWELLLPLTVGAELVVAEPDGHRDPAYLVATIERHLVTTVHFVPPMLDAFLGQSDLHRCHTLRHVVCSGQALPPHLVRRFHQHLKAQLHNYYGPTEASIDITAWTCDPSQPTESVPIGRPIAGAQTQILDGHLQPVPTGTPGELYLGGVGLARGYLHRPDLTAERFVPHPWQPGVRLYRTGDLTRWNPDGTIDYLGRTDQQLKINGHRIEPGEVENALRDHLYVRDAAVRAHSDPAGHTALVGYLVPDSGQQELSQAVQAASQDTVSEWQEVFDTAYRAESTGADPLTNFASWASSYTGLALPADEMAERADETARAVRAERPARVLDIGCGTGLLLFRVAPGCERYVGTDLSQEGLDYITEHLAPVGIPAGRVDLRRQAAHDLSGLTGQRFDVAVLDSVIQYFPSVGYLLDVLKAAARVIRPGGAIMLFDVRHLALLESFHAAVEATRAPADMTIAALKDRVAERVAEENELALDPTFFRVLPRLIPQFSDVRIELKRGRARNELTQFRYNVVLRVGPETTGTETTTDPDRRTVPGRTLDWTAEGLTMASAGKLLAESIAESQEKLVLTRIPNARLSHPLSLAYAVRAADRDAATVELLRQRQEREPAPDGVDPEELAGQCEAAGYAVSLAWSVEDTGRFDLTAWRQPGPPPSHLATPADGSGEVTSLEHWANNPTHNRLHGTVVPAVRQALREQVADYSVPNHFVVLDRLPLGSTGKVDYAALPPPRRYSSAEDAEFVAPRNPLERTLAEIWAGVLGVDQVGVTSGFFEIGGDSMRCVQVVSKASRAGIGMSVQQMFQHQTIAELATALGGEPPAGDDAAQGSPTTGVTDPAVTQPALAGPVTGDPSPAEPGISDRYALSPLQQWMLRRRLTAPLPGLYTSHSVMAVTGRQLDPEAFAGAWQRLVERHAPLRSAFRWTGPGDPYQVVHQSATVPFEYQDWRTVRSEQRDQNLADLVLRLRTTPLDLDSAPQLKLVLLRFEDRAYRLALALNYMQIDGWSYPLLIREAIALVNAAHGDPAPVLADRPPYRDYIEWTLRQDEPAAVGFWSEEMRDFATPTPLAAGVGSEGRRSDAPPKDALSVVKGTALPATLTAALRARARLHGVTLYTLVQAAWALVLHAYTGESDVVFGNVLSGRSPEVPGADHIVGYCNLQIPARVRVEGAATAAGWLQRLQARQAEAREHQRLALPRIAELSQVPRGTPLYQSCLIYMDVPLSTGAATPGWRRLDSMTQTDHLLRFVVRPEQALQVNLAYSYDTFTDEQVRRLLDGVCAVLAGMAHSLTVTVGHLAALARKGN